MLEGFLSLISLFESQQATWEKLPRRLRTAWSPSKPLAAMIGRIASPPQKVVLAMFVKLVRDVLLHKSGANCRSSTANRKIRFLEQVQSRTNTLEYQLLGLVNG
ncbi:hypothetical protein [Rhizobium gallicum]|uniref:hypothetical protein n=1 Tax=Rhizobium gallicum TaxID=56730 RepID=UPI001EF78760|nr:hypothetical protein [Rhizobium gallicum]ULJ73323.1 hypothetical protein L2W42_06875 [Rhizobium gallicum]